MFYSTQILAKKGPLGTIWIAAHLERRLKRHQVFETSITISVDSIINPDAPLALRLSGQLLLGVVRIYSRKVGYLFQDCNEALLKIKSAFTQSALVDLPLEHATANVKSITLPESYEGIEFFTDVEASMNLRLQEGDQGLGDDLAFTIRDDSITLDADFNALTFDASPAEDEMFEVEEDLDLENTRYVSDEGQSAGDDSIEDPEVLRAAGTPGDNVGTLDFNLLGGGSISAMLPEATHPTKTLEADAEDEHEAAGDFPPREETPSARSLDLDVQQGYTPGVLPGDTPGNELAVVGDTPEGTAQRHSADDDDVYEDFEAPELGNSGLVSADAPWGTSSSHLHGQSAHQRSRKHEVDVDDGADGRPGKEMPGASIRSLLLDRAPLLTNRGFRGGVNTKQDKKLDRKRKLLRAQNLMRKPAIPGPVGLVLFGLWQSATSASSKIRAGALREAKHSAACSKARQQTTAAEEPQSANGLDVLQEHETEEDPADAECISKRQCIEEHAASEDEGGQALYDDGFIVDGSHHDEDDVIEPHLEQQKHKSITSDDGDNDRDDIPAPVELLQSCDQEPGADGTSDAQATTFTSNTRAVLKHLKSLSERKETGDSASSNKDRGTIASLNALLGKKRRLDASRWFFELLVLKSKDYVDLDQKESFGDINIKVGPKLKPSTRAK